MSPDLVVRSRRAVLPGGEQAASVAIAGGRIVGVESYEAADGLAGVPVDTLADGLALLPGLVDTHVHCNEPGRTGWEGFATATRAAAAGGITTILDMPLNSIPPTTTVEALEVKRAAAEGQVHVDVGFWGGAVPENPDDLGALLAAGAFGAKCFLAPSGVAEFGHLDAAGLRVALERLAAGGGLLLVHAEDPGVLDASARTAGTSFPAFAAGRPGEAEAAAVHGVVEAVRTTGGRAHIVHVAARGAVGVLAAAHREGLTVSGETCPHYLTFAFDGTGADAVPDGAPQYKCCPPIRDRSNREALWDGLADGTLGIVVSDHSPSTPDLKHLDTGDLDAAWGGIASVQVSLPVTWTAARARGFGLSDVVRWMASGPADLAGLTDRGRIAVGHQADLVAFDPGSEWTVDPAALHHRHPVTPYTGMAVRGEVRTTYLRGMPVTDEPRGQLLRSRP